MLLLMVKLPLVIMPVTPNVITSPFWALVTAQRNVPGPIDARLVTTSVAAGLKAGIPSQPTRARAARDRKNRLGINE